MRVLDVPRQIKCCVLENSFDSVFFKISLFKSILSLSIVVKDRTSI